MKNTIKQLLWFVIPFLICIIALITLYVIPVNMGMFNSKQYIRLMLNDNIFIKSLFNTYRFIFVTLAPGLILGNIIKLLSKRVPKNFEYIPAIVAGAIFIVLFWLMISSFLHRISREPISLVLYIIIYKIIFIGIGFYICLFAASRFKNIYARNAIKYGGITSLFFASMQLNAAYIALVGFPSTDYAAHTITKHLTDFTQIRILPYNIFSLMNYILSLAFCIIICFIYWALERLFLYLKAKIKSKRIKTS